MLTEYRCDRNVAGVAPPSDQAPANAAAVMPRVVAKINTLTKGTDNQPRHEVAGNLAACFSAFSSGRRGLYALRQERRRRQKV
jgi:hypothetical protein